MLQNLQMFLLYKMVFDNGIKTFWCKSLFSKFWILKVNKLVQWMIFLPNLIISCPPLNTNEG